MDDDRSAFRHSIVGKYGPVVLFMALNATGLFLICDPPGLIALKTCSVPLVHFANRGLDAIFASDASKRVWTVAYFERHFLYSVVFASWLTVVMWNPSLTSADQIRSFLVAVTIMTVLRAWLTGIGIENDDRGG